MTTLQIPWNSTLNLSCRALSRTTLDLAVSKTAGGFGLDFQRELHLRALRALKLHHDGVQDRIERLHRTNHVDFDRAVEAARLAWSVGTGAVSVCRLRRRAKSRLPDCRRSGASSAFSLELIERLGRAHEHRGWRHDSRAGSSPRSDCDSGRQLRRNCRRSRMSDRAWRRHRGSQPQARRDRAASADRRRRRTIRRSRRSAGAVDRPARSASAPAKALRSKLLKRDPVRLRLVVDHDGNRRALPRGDRVVFEVEGLARGVALHRIEDVAPGGADRLQCRVPVGLRLVACVRQPAPA